MRQIILTLLLITSFSSYIFAQADTTVLTNQYGVIVDRHPLEPEFRNGILNFETKDKAYRLWFDNRIYVDGAYFFDDNTYNKIGNGVTIRRARFALKTIIHDNWYGELDLDFAGSQTEMKDMVIGYISSKKSGIFKNVSIKLGNFKEGFSMEETTTSRYVTFIERSFIAKLAPSRHLGVQFTKFDRFYTVIGGVHFQDLGGFEESSFSQDHNKANGMDEGVSYTGRAVARYINKKQDFVVHLGSGYSYRTPKTSWEISDAYRYSTRTLSNINRKKYLDTDDIKNVDSRTLLDFEFASAWKNFMFHAEYLVTGLQGTDLNRVAGITESKSEGAFAQVGWLIFGGHYRYNVREAEFTQVARGKTWGDIELAFRYDYLNLNDFKAKIYGGGANAYTFGINYHVNSNVKFMLNYSYAEHDRYANGKGKLYIGYDSNGALTKDWTKVDETKGAPGERFGFIQLRAEIDF
jgi:phosphate-selective porin OprO/OprP